MHKTKAEFVRDGKSVAIPVSELDKNVPYGICVFACRLEEEDEEKERLHVYPSDAQENTWFLPVKVKAQIRYRKRLFSSEKYGILYVPRIADYRDGAVCCRVDGAASLLPLPQACLGRELVITMPKRAKLCLSVREADRKYFEGNHVWEAGRIFHEKTKGSPIHYHSYFPEDKRLAAWAGKM